jgi:hypothetical protein
MQITDFKRDNLMLKQASCALFLLIGCSSSEPAPPTAPEGDSTAAQGSADVMALPAPALTRSGEPPSLPQASPQRSDSPCGYSMAIDSLFSLSSRYLRDAGLGNSSPLTLLEDGVPLSGFAHRRDFEEHCTGAFTVARNVIWFSPSGSSPAARDGRSYTLALSEALPMQTPDGPAWWVYTGQALDARFDDSAAQVGRSVTISATLRTPQKKPKELPQLRVAGQSADFSLGSAGLWSASLSLPVPDGPWTVSVASLGEGPYLLLDSLTLSADGKTRDLLAPDTSTDSGPGPVAPVTGGSLLDPEQVRFASAPPELSTTALIAIGERAAKMMVPELKPLSPQAVQQRLGTKYSPVRIMENGKPLPQPMSPCSQVKSDGNGQYCHSHDVLLFSASDTSNPITNGRSYQITLDPERRFSSGWWLYPMDILTGGSFSGTTMTLQATPITDDAALTIRLIDPSGAAVVEEEVDEAVLSGGPVIITAPAAGTYTLELRTRGHVVLTDASAG